MAVPAEQPSIGRGPRHLRGSVHERRELERAPRIAPEHERLRRARVENLAPEPALAEMNEAGTSDSRALGGVGAVAQPDRLLDAVEARAVPVRPHVQAVRATEL